MTWGKGIGKLHKPGIKQVLSKVYQHPPPPYKTKKRANHLARFSIT